MYVSRFHGPGARDGKPKFFLLYALGLLPHRQKAGQDAVKKDGMRREWGSWIGRRNSPVYSDSACSSAPKHSAWRDVMRWPGLFAKKRMSVRTFLRVWMWQR